jgi:hypothetical protein
MALICRSLSFFVSLIRRQVIVFHGGMTLSLMSSSSSFQPLRRPTLGPLDCDWLSEERLA